MGDWRNYFSFRGRLNRKPYWLMNLILGGVGLLGFLVVSMFAAMLPLFWALAAPLGIAFFAAGLSIATRRLHDRNKSAWWLLLYQGVPLVLGVLQGLMEAASGRGAGPADLLGFVNFCISMWVLADLGFMKGKPGANRFGDDPLGPPIQEVFA
jgi:uncharacterized membrane protein YhaH (DUF805 family)